MAEKSKLAQKWSSLTGITYSIDPLIAQAGSDEQKVKLYAELVWCIYRGRVTNNQWVAENAIDCTTGLSVLLLKDITTEGWEPSEDFLTEEEIAILKKWIEEGSPVKVSENGGLELDDEGAVKVKCGQGIGIDEETGALICKCGGEGARQYYSGKGTEIDSDYKINVKLGSGLDFDENDALKVTSEGKTYTAGSYITISDDNVISAEDMHYDDANVLSYISDIQSDLDNKQDILNAGSYVTITDNVIDVEDMHYDDTAIKTSITKIDKLIPSEASEDNQLADKAYVDTKAISNLVETTYKDLAQNATMGKLVPGTWYRITDYQCTTTESKTKSAGHQFDIIVLADSETQLNCKAHAALHEGDTYFANCDLSKWELWYDINNDKTKYVWADTTTNGKGVIYRMIDEYNNDCPYDFKNIQYYRGYNSDRFSYSIAYGGPTSDTVLCYTFSNRFAKGGTSSDMSLSRANYVYDNKISVWYNNGIQQLNDNVFFGMLCYGNFIGVNTYNISLGDCYIPTQTGEHYFGLIYNNRIGADCYMICFGIGFIGNVIGNECDNTFGNRHFYDNTFGNDCKNISFAQSGGGNQSGCKFMTFGDNVQNIYFYHGSTVDTLDFCGKWIQNITINSGFNCHAESKKTVNIDTWIPYASLDQEWQLTIASENDMTATL